MNSIKQGILMAIAAFIFSMLFSYFMDGKINWILSFGIASGFLLGTLMKIKNIWILIVVVGLVLVLMMSKFGFVIWPLLVFAAVAIIIHSISKFANKLVDALTKRQVSIEDSNAKIELIMQRIQVIENKIDNMNRILEKVSE